MDEKVKEKLLKQIELIQQKSYHADAKELIELSKVMSYLVGLLAGSQFFGEVSTAPATLTLRTSEMNPYPHGHPMFMSHGTPITDEEAKAWKENFLKECAEKGIVFKNGVGLGEVSTAQRPGSPKGCTLSFAGTGAHRHSFPNTWKPNPEDYMVKDLSSSSTVNDPENNNS